MENQRNNLDRALAMFIEAMRMFISLEMAREYGKSWDQEYYEALSDHQKRDWDNQARGGKDPEQMIDFHTLGIFAIRQRNFLKKFFGHRESGNLATKFNEIADARNMFAHYDEWDKDKAEMAFGHMIGIAKSLEMTELEDELRNLKDDVPVEKQIEQQIEEEKEVVRTPSTTAWFNNVRPHLDIREGNLDESVFAADLAEVALGAGRVVYNNQSIFFDKTHFTAGLTNIANRVVKGLNGHEDGENRVISLQTGFGGGKTHTLISLYHLVKAGKGITSNPKVSERLSELPNFEKANIAVFTNTTNDPTQGRKEEDVRIHTLWGELAWQLGGAPLYEKIRPNDEARTAPKGLFYEILKEASPSLILIDELADYCVAASGVQVGGSTLSDQTISFMQELTEAVAKVKNCVLVVTLPASVSEVATSDQAQKILSSLEDRVKRVGADTLPVAEEEIFEVIRHRLFEGVGNEEVTERVLQSYVEMYTGLWAELPEYANKHQYMDLMKRAYPFHPELINIFKNKWASHPNFQRTRGVLRLLASVVSDLWRRRHNLVGSQTLIHPSHIYLDNLDTLVGEVKKLYGNGYEAVISSDVSGVNSNAYKIDQEKSEYGDYHLAQGISSTIFLNSFGNSGKNKGISVKEMKLQLLVPHGFNHNSINSCLDDLQGRAFHLYYSSTSGSGQRFWFHTKPNLNILINNAIAGIKDDRIESEILRRLTEETSRMDSLNVIVNPSDDVPEQKRPTLVILPPSIFHNGNKKLEEKIHRIALKKGQTDRIYRNTLLFLSMSELGKSSVYSAVREYLAARKVKEEENTTLEEDQKEEVDLRIAEGRKKVLGGLVTAYNQVHKYVAAEGLQTLELRNFTDSFRQQISGTLMEVLKEEEWLLDSVGANMLRRNNLLPEDGKPVRVVDIVEAFLRYDDKPIITHTSGIKESVSRYCYNRHFAIGSKSYGDWTKMYFGETVPMFDEKDDSYWILTPTDYESWKAEQRGEETPIEESAHDPVAETGIEAMTPRATEKSESGVETIREFSRITVRGKANAISFNQVFSSFIMPLKENDVEIEFVIRAKTNKDYPLKENSQQYKIVKESASQLDFDLDVE